MKTTTIKQVLVCAIALGLIDCSGVSFGTKKGQTNSSGSNSSASTAGSSGSGSSGTLNQTGNSGASGTTVPGPLPKVRWSAPECIRLTACVMNFDLQAPVSGTFEFDWVTNDVLWQQTNPPPPAGYIYARAAVHYTHKSGHVIFVPGEIHQQVTVQNINQDPTIKIIIGLNFSVCTYNGNIGNCGGASGFFY